VALDRVDSDADSHCDEDARAGRAQTYGHRNTDAFIAHENAPASHADGRRAHTRTYTHRDARFVLDHRYAYAATHGYAYSHTDEDQ
jgi:hypothetical protein